MKRVKKKIKKYIAFLAVLIILVSITVTPAHAITPNMNRMKAFIASAITALNIAMTSGSAPITDMLNFIGDPFNVNYTYTEAFNDRPTIQIWDDYVTIDGVEYTDIWISNEAAEKFRVDGFDFISAYNIASNSNGTFASGVGHIDGLPLFDFGSGTASNPRYRTQEYALPYNSSGTLVYPISDNVNAHVINQGTNDQVTLYNGESTSGLYNGSSGNFPVEIRYVLNTIGNPRSQRKLSTDSDWPSSTWNIPGTFNYSTNDPFDFDWVSENIPTDTPLPSDTGMMIRVPTDSNIIDFITDNPEFNQPGGVVIDPSLDPTIITKLDDLINIIAPIIPVINNNYGDVTFSPNHVEPGPVQDTLLPDTYKQEILQPITQTINNQTTQIIESIPNINDICNNIDTAPYHDLDTGLDHLPTVFLPFITDLRSALGIWHYVTDWLSQISTTFAFITGCLVGTSIMTPIYAAIAGFICIKIYRRMTG